MMHHVIQAAAGISPHVNMCSEFSGWIPIILAFVIGITCGMLLEKFVRR